MQEKHQSELSWFVTKASLFVFLHALGTYLFLQIFNVYSDGFIAEVFDIKIPLVVAIISSFILAVFVSSSRTKQDQG